MIKLDKLPLPPSSNKLYSSFRGRLIKSKAGREFDSKIEFYALTHKRQIQAAKKQVNELLEDSPFLKVRCIFVFHIKRIYSLKGELKQLDTSNRIKATHDAVARLLGVDDKHFKNVPCDMASCEDVKNEQVLVYIEKGELLRFEDL